MDPIQESSGSFQEHYKRGRESKLETLCIFNNYEHIFYSCVEKLKKISGLNATPAIVLKENEEIIANKLQVANHLAHEFVKICIYM